MLSDSCLDLGIATNEGFRRLPTPSDLEFTFRPSFKDFGFMFRRLLALYGMERLAAACGIAVGDLVALHKTGHRLRQARRVIWMLYCVKFEPWRWKGDLDLLTWGAFAKPPAGWKPRRVKRRKAKKRRKRPVKTPQENAVVIPQSPSQDSIISDLPK